MRRWGLSGLLMLLVAGSVAGCGGSSSGASRQITSTIKSFLSDLGSGNGGAACQLLTPTGQKALAAQGPASDVTCSQVISTASKAFNASEQKKLKNATVTNIKITGNSATAQLKGGTGTAHLSKTGGKWLISGGLNG
jgi:hypothetical protein